MKIFSKSFSILYIYPFFLGSLTVFSFQPFNLTLLNFLVLPIFFYLLVFINKKSKSTYRKKPYKKNFFIFGTAFGFGYYLSGIHWIVNSLTFDDTFKFLIPIGLILIPLFLSLFFSILLLFIGPFLNNNLSSLFILSAGLAFSDFIKAKILTGFPWNLWAYSFSGFTEIIQLLNLLGLFAFNLITITFFLLPSVYFFNINYVKKFAIFLLLPLLLSFLYIYGNYKINQNQKNINLVDKNFFVKVVSPNFNLKYGLTERELRERLKKIIRYSEPSKNTDTLFIWPEGVFGGYNFKEIKNLKKIFQSNFSKNHLILFGINRVSDEDGGIYNTMVIVNNELEILQEYKKQKLVPFGEFLPLEKLLNKLGIKKITEGHGSFLKGGKQQNLVINQLNIFPLICYEVIFTKLTQNLNDNTNLIVNISEDGWFGNSIGPHQHFAKSIFRSIEQNLYLIRSTNKGISAIINNKGEIIKKLNATEAGNIQYEVPLIESKNRNKNDLIFFVLLITYIFIFRIYKTN